MAAPRVFVAYAHASEGHKRAVERLVVVLRARGLDVRFDQYAIGPRQSWSTWAEREIRAADAVIVVGSPQCKAERTVGIRTELGVLRELLAEDYHGAMRRIFPVILPGHTVDDVPGFLRPRDYDHYEVTVDVDTNEGIDGLVTAIRGDHVRRPAPLGGAAPSRAPAPVPLAVPVHRLAPLVDALAAIPDFGSPGTRDQLVALLRREIAGAVARSTRTRTEAVSLVTTCLRFDRGLAELAEAVRLWAGDVPEAQAFIAAATRSG